MKSGDTIRIRPQLDKYDEPEGVPLWLAWGGVIAALLGLGTAVWLALSAGAAVWWAWITADNRGWQRGFKSAEKIWKSGFYELLEQMKSRRA